MEKNLYWVKISAYVDLQDPGLGRKTHEYFISATPDGFEKELAKVKANHRGDVAVESIARL